MAAKAVHSLTFYIPRCEMHMVFFLFFPLPLRVGGLLTRSHDLLRGYQSGHRGKYAVWRMAGRGSKSGRSVARLPQEEYKGRRCSSRVDSTVQEVEDDQQHMATHYCNTTYDTPWVKMWTCMMINDHDRLELAASHQSDEWTIAPHRL